MVPVKNDGKWSTPAVACHAQTLKMQKELHVTDWSFSISIKLKSVLATWPRSPARGSWIPGPAGQGPLLLGYGDWAGQTRPCWRGPAARHQLGWTRRWDKKRHWTRSMGLVRFLLTQLHNLPDYHWIFNFSYNTPIELAFFYLLFRQSADEVFNWNG